MKAFLAKIIVILSALFINIFATYSWYSVSSPTGNNINDLELRTPTYGWLAGTNNTSRFSGSIWSSFPISGSYDIQGVSAVNDNCAWAVAPNGKALKFNGSQWQTLGSTTSQDLNDIYMLTNASGWIVGNQTILHYDGLSWANLSFPGSDTFNWQSIFVVQANNIWIGANNGTIAGFTGSTWIKYQTPSAANITGIWFTAAGNGWACSDAGEILHWNGSQWSVVSQPNTTPLYGICVPSSTLGYAVGNNGRIVKYNGTNWSIYPDSPTTQRLNAIFMYSTTLGFIVGNAGTLLEYGPVDTVESASLGIIKATFSQ